MVIFSPQAIIQIRPSSVILKCVKILPIGLLVELLSEQQASHPNQLILPTIDVWIPSKSIVTSFGFLSLQQVFTSKSLW
jgi:hypothetical protein